MHGTVCELMQSIVIYYMYSIYALDLQKESTFIFTTTKGSMNACMELVGLSTSNNVQNHRFRWCVLSIYKVLYKT